MSNVRRRIADLTEERRRIYAEASGRPLAIAEVEQIRSLTKALNDAWAVRRMELARQPQIDHELIIVTTLKERTA